MMVDEARAPFARPATSRFVLAVALVALCWIIGNAPNSGPDEPSHMITSAGIVRLQGGGEPNDGVTRIVEVPAMVGLPDPSCWAFVPDATPACSEDVGSTTVVERATTSFNYPVWAMILPGLASYVPWPGGYDYLARALSALIPVVLVGAALAFVTPTRRLVGAAALLGVTPIAWFTFGTVNPSAVAIGGGLALLAGLLTVDRRPRADLLAVAGWVAVVLPRRDGPLWATVVVVAACALTAARPSEMWARLCAPWRWAVPLAVLIAVARLLAITSTVSNEL